MKNSWNLLLVNRSNPLPENYEYNLRSLKNGECVDVRIYSDLVEMIETAEKQNVFMFVNWGFRSAKLQQLLFDSEVLIRKNRGLSDEEALAETKKYVAAVGASEHETGLAVDLDPIKPKSIGADIYKWLADNSYKFGFILRYPENKTEITGFSYEPWHFRYVGKEAAKQIFDKGICLEEYLQSL